MNRAQDPIRRAMAIVCVPLVAACAFLVAACGDDGGGMTEPDLNPNPAQEDQKVATVELTPANVALSSLGSSTTLTAAAKDEKGNVLDNVRFVWQSSDPSVVVVDSVGRVVSKGPGTAVVTAVAGAIPGHVPVTVTQTAASLAFRVHPADAVAGAALSPAIQVEIRDEAGHRVKSATDAVTLSLVGGGQGVELEGTRTVNAVDGVATFSGLVVERAGDGYRVRARVGALETVESEAFGVVPAAPAKLGFLSVPEEVVAGDTFEVRVGVQDVYGNVVPAAGGRPALSLTSGPEGAELEGDLEVEAEAGVAVFEVVLERADSAYVLAVMAPGLEAGWSERFRIVPREPHRLVFIDPRDSVDVGWFYTYTVGVADTFGNLVRGIDSVTVTVQYAAYYVPVKDTTVVMMDGEASFQHMPLTPWGDATQSGERLTVRAPDENWGSAWFEPIVHVEWRSVVSGPDRTCGIVWNQRLYCWGNATKGRLGTDWGPSYLPNPVAGGKRWQQVVIGRDHTCARDNSGVVHCWGGNEFGQLGINDASVEYATEPTAVDTHQRFSEIAAGEYHTCGVTRETNRVFCWGRNDHGQLGSAGGDAYAPRPADSDLEFERIAAGGNHTCALRNKVGIYGHAYCWGDNAFGQLGNRSTMPSSAPDSVAFSGEFRRIAAGTSHTCGIGEQGVVYCWGSNAHNQLGIGMGGAMDSVPRGLDPERINAREITAGENHTCIITDRMWRPYCWGANDFGQLGRGDTFGHPDPMPVMIDARFNSISAGSTHTCAAVQLGPAYCWGSNANGQLGLGGFVDRVYYLPRPVGLGGG